MIRIFIIVVLLIAVSLGVVYLAQLPGSLSFDMFGFEGTLGVAPTVLLLALMGALIALVVSLLTGLIRLPGKVGKSRETSKIRKANNALAEGLLAAEAGDAKTALKLAKKAAKHAEDDRLGLLLEARAAEVGDDWAGAERAWGQLARLPGGQLAGLRGSATAASERGDLLTAETRAREALSIKSNAEWPFNSLFDMQVSKGDWDKALETLSIGDKRGIIKGDSLRRRRAVLHTARAVNLSHDRRADAQKALAEAIRSAPAFPPAAWHGARHLMIDDKLKAAQGVLELAWKARPHPALTQLARRLATKSHPNNVERPLKSLMDTHPGHRESRILSAELAMDRADWVDAIKTLALLVEENPTARLCLLMERALKGYGDTEEAQRWGRMAVSASREADWSDLDPKGGAFDYDPRDWARLVYAFGDVGELVHPRYETYGRELEAGRPLALPNPEADAPVTPPKAPDAPLMQPLDYVAEDDD
jgi:HemY protein